jgi:PGF-pre-PGF domain-containing protein
VSRDRLSSAGLRPEDVALYRFNDGEYTEYDASVESEGDDRITYIVESPGLSVFTIGEATA